MKKTVIIGPGCLDLVTRVDNMPKGNEDIQANLKEKRISGFGWNAANLFNALNLDYIWMGAIGSGLYGDEVASAVKKYGMNNQCQVPEIAGCTYSVVDNSGNATTLTVPGAEYIFRNEFLNSLDCKDVYMTICSGSLLEKDSSGDLLQFLKKAGRLIIAPGSRAVIYAQDKVRETYEMHPSMYLTAEEAWMLTDGKRDELSAISEELFSMTSGAVIIRTEDQKIYYRDADLTFSMDLPETRVLDRSGEDDGFVAGLAAGLSSGLKIRQALYFAGEIESRIVKNKETVLNAEQAEQATDLLRKLILGR